MSASPPNLSPAADTPPPSPPRRRHRRRYRWALLAALPLLLLLLAALAAWLLTTESGRDTAFAIAHRVTAGRLSFGPAQGTLTDSLYLSEIRWEEKTSETPPAVGAQAEIPASPPSPPSPPSPSSPPVASASSTPTPTPATFRLVLRDVRLTWRAFHRDRVEIAELSAALVDIVSPPSDTPPSLPADLSLPLGVVIDALRVDLLQWRSAVDAAPIEIAAITARAESDGTRHRIEKLALSFERIRAGLDATLEGHAPFQLDARARLEGGGEYPFQLALTAAGPLEKLNLAAKAEGTIRGEGTARIEPLAPMPLTVADVKLFGIDPATWVEGAPRATLDVVAHITPTASPTSDTQAKTAPPSTTEQSGNKKTGNAKLPLEPAPAAPPESAAPEFTAAVAIENHAPGTIDAGALPVAALHLTLAGNADRIVFRDARAALRGGGRLEGSGHYEAGKVDFSGQAHGIDALALDARLKPTQLSGPLRYSHDDRGETFEATLSDPRFSVSTRLNYHGQNLNIESLTLAAREARLAAAGQFRLAAPKSFSFEGKLEHFDPSRFVQAPAADLSARIKTQGTLDPELSLALDLALDPSTFNKQNVGGGGHLRLHAGRVSDTDIKLEIGGNKLSAHGAFGAPGDTLTLVLDAPGLDLFGFSGAGNANLSVGGTRAQPVATLSLSVPKLQLPDGTRLTNLSAGGRVEAGNEGALQLNLALEQLAGANKRVLANVVTLVADGKRNAQTWMLNARLPSASAQDSRQLAVTLDGGFDAEGQWQGKLSRADFGRFAPCRAVRKTENGAESGAESDTKNGAAKNGATNNGTANNGESDPRQMDGLALTAPAPLSWRQNVLTLEAANFDAGAFSPCGETKKAGARDYTPGRIEIGLLRLGKDIATRGRLVQLPLGWLNSAAGTLRFNGDWDLNLAADAASGATGRAHFEYASGRLLPEQATTIKTRRGTEIQTPDIKALTADLTVKANRVAAVAKVTGVNDSAIDGEFEFTLDPVNGWTPKRDAAWKGALNVALPSLSGIGPVFDRNLRIRGSVSGAFQLGGTPAAPALTGVLAGNNLTVRRVDFGTNLRDGQIVLRLDNSRLRLDQFSFNSPLAQEPRDQRIGYAALSATPGKITASGEMDLIGGRGDLSWEFDRFGVMQKPDSWLVLSGKGDVAFSEKHFGLKGKIAADAGYFELPPAAAPKLGDDVVVRGRETEKNPPIPFDLNLEADLGRALWFHGAGVDTRLAGKLQITAEAADKTGTLYSKGTIRAFGGTFDAYGVSLVLERGIFTFNGPIDNPVLSIRAIRRNQPVEAGVEVGGTVQKPKVKLVSSPNVPDTEKLSWMILGRAPETGAGGDAALLLSAAGDLLGQGSGPVREMQRSLGIDQIGVRSGSLSGQDGTGTSRVASTQGFSNTTTNTDQLVTVGKRLSNNTSLAYEQSLTSAGSIIKLTVQLSRSLSLIGRAGSDNALDLFYSFSFGKDPAQQAPAQGEAANTTDTAKKAPTAEE